MIFRVWFSILVVLAPAGLAQSLVGVIDIHAHSDPDSTPRSIDAIDLARLAKSRGMRGLVLKNHYEPTASLAYIVRKEVSGIEVFGGISLDRTVGGVNPAAVEKMTHVKGGWGRVVWMPTFDAENQVRYSKESRPFVSVARDGRLLPETIAVISIIAKNHLVLATGHSSSREGLMLIREGVRQGVMHMVVTHAMIAPTLMPIGEMREASRLGAYIEFVYNALLESHAPGPKPELTIHDYVDAIRQVGPEFCILSSDLGQVGNPLHPDGLLRFFAELKKNGISEADIDRMSKVNPAKLLGLP
ncbi:MAG: DUF6282 family protein [Acidobacteriota bacterium]|nr:DUF6282 family protein [Acidobacteriota bacterium]